MQTMEERCKYNQRWQKLQYFINNDKPEIVASLIERLMVRDLSYKEAGIKKSRIVAAHQELPPSSLDYMDNKWRQFSMTEAIWCRMMAQSKMDKLPAKTITKLKKILRPYFRVFLFRFGKEQDLIGITYIGNKQIAEKMISDRLIDRPSKLLTVQTPMNDLVIGLVKCICGLAPVSIVVYDNGDYNMIDSRSNEGIDVKCKSYRILRLFKIVEEFVGTNKISSSVANLRLLDQSELWLLNLLREDRQIKMTLDFNDNKKIRIATQSIKEKVDKDTSVDYFLKQGGYQSVEAYEVDGEITGLIRNIKKKPPE